VLEDRAQVTVVSGVDPVDHRLEPSAHDRQRRSQFVRHIGEERAPLRVDRAEASSSRSPTRTSSTASCALSARRSTALTRATSSLGLNGLVM
jgi:hypothetical protein